MSGVPAALLASLLWGFADFLAGRAGRRNPPVIVAVVGQLSGLVALSFVLLIRGADAGAVGPGVLAGAIGVVGVLAFYQALALGPMSIVAPIGATGAIVPVIAGVLEGDRPHAVQWVGVAVALIGVILASYESSATATKASKAGPRIAVLGAVAIGFTLYFLGKAAEHDALTGVAVARLTAVPVLALLALRMRASAPRQALPGLIGIGLLDTGANTAFAVATTGGLLALVAVLGGLFPVVTVALAYFLLHERLQPLQRAGVVLALAGIPLISA